MNTTLLTEDIGRLTPQERRDLAGSTQDPAVHQVLMQWPEQGCRVYLARSPWIGPTVQHHLLKGGEGERTALARNSIVQGEVLERLLADPSEHVRAGLAQRRELELEMQYQLLKEALAVREALAGREDLDPAVQGILSFDPEGDIRQELAYGLDYQGHVRLSVEFCDTYLPGYLNRECAKRGILKEWQSLRAGWQGSVQELLDAIELLAA